MTVAADVVTLNIGLCVCDAVRHGRRFAPEAPQRSEDVESVMALAIIIPVTAKPVFIPVA